MSLAGTSTRRGGRRPSWWKDALFDELRGREGSQERAVGSTCRACGAAVRDAQRNATRLAKHVLRCRAIGHSRKERVWQDCSWAQKNIPPPVDERREQATSNVAALGTTFSPSNCERNASEKPNFLSSSCAFLAVRSKKRKRGRSQHATDAKLQGDSDSDSQIGLAMVRWATTHLIPIGAFIDDSFSNIIRSLYSHDSATPRTLPSGDELAGHWIAELYLSIDNDLRTMLAPSEARMTRHTLLLYTATALSERSTGRNVMALLVRVGQRVFFVDMFVSDFKQKNSVESCIRGIRQALCAYGGMRCIGSVATDLSDHADAVASRLRDEYPDVIVVRDQIILMRNLVNYMSGLQWVREILFNVNRVAEFLESHASVLDISLPISSDKFSDAENNVVLSETSLSDRSCDDRAKESTTFARIRNADVVDRPVFNANHESGVLSKCNISRSDHCNQQALRVLDEHRDRFRIERNDHLPQPLKNRNESGTLLDSDTLNFVKSKLSSLRGKLGSHGSSRLGSRFAKPGLEQSCVRELVSDQEFLSSVTLLSDIANILCRYIQQWGIRDKLDLENTGLSCVIPTLQMLRADVVAASQRFKSRKSSFPNAQQLDEIVQIFESQTHNCESGSRTKAPRMVDNMHTLAYVLNPARCPSDMGLLMPSVVAAIKEYCRERTWSISEKESAGTCKACDNSGRPCCKHTTRLENSREVRLLKALGLYLQLDEATFGRGVHLRSRFHDDPSSWWVLFASSPKVAELRDLAIRLLSIPAGPVIDASLVGLQPWVDSETALDFGEEAIKRLFFCHQNLRLAQISSNTPKFALLSSRLHINCIEQFVGDHYFQRSMSKDSAVLCTDRS